MLCFAFEHYLQYELSKSPLFVIMPNLQKNRLCSEGYISDGNTSICFILVVNQYS